MAAESLLLKLKERGHLIGPLSMASIVVLIIVPLPSYVLDVFFTINIILAVSILFITTYINDAVDFSVYPTILLLSSLYRLALNISSTRLILTRGNEGIYAAGKVIGSFGKFVIGGNFVIGLVVFIIIVVIQFMVVAHGSVRASEVTARFTLDKMPGKQLSIDADLNSGLITEKEARERRDRIEKESEFYGAMDGAIRFTSREAIASIIITIVNIIGGILIGIFQQGMDFASASSTYSILTVGDGLMASIPSLLITVSAGFITFRAVSDKTMGEDLLEQTLFNYKPIMFAGSILLILGLIPGLPKIPFFLIGGSLAFIAYRIKQQSDMETEAKQQMEQEEEKVRPPERIESLLKVDLLGLEIGYSLIQLVDASKGGNLLDRIKAMRKQIARELGIIVPPVRIRDNLQLNSREYSILIKNMAIAGAQVMPGKSLAINPGNVREKLKGKETSDPAFGLPAYWVSDSELEKAQVMGYTIVDATTVVTTHLTEVIKTHAHELLGRQETQHLLDNLAESYPKVVEELVPNLMTLGNVQKVLQNLLKERVSILDLRSILETLADFCPLVKNVTQLTELVRQTLGRTIVKPYVTNNNDLPVIVMGGEIENIIGERLETIDGVEQLVVQPGDVQAIVDKVKVAVEKSGTKVQPILLCSSRLRPHLKFLTEKFLPGLVVLSASEIPKNINIVSLGVIE